MKIGSCLIAEIGLLLSFAITPLAQRVNPIPEPIWVENNHDFVHIQGKSSDTGTTMCWKVRGGKSRVRNKIVLAKCKPNDEAQLFALQRFGSPELPINLSWVTVHPKLDPEMVVVGVREAKNKGWLRIEYPEGLDDLLRTQIFTTGPFGPPQDAYMVQLGWLPDCNMDDTCLYVTNQGLNTNGGKPVMLRTGKELKRFKKHGDVIEKWSFE